jgi:hypothetical protein
MIGLTSRGKSFGALAAYLTRGHDRQSPERVAWLSTRNLASEDPQVAAHIMKATAGLSRRVQKPVYHLGISWAAADRPTPELMTEVMDAALARLGLADHQAVYVAHQDTAHPHLHAMINRVHPETGKAWDGKRDHIVLREFLMEQEQALGLTPTPRRRGEGRGPGRKELALAARQQRPALRPMTDESRERLREDLRHPFETAISWRDIEDRLQRRGLALTPAGAGVRIVKGDRFVKLSEVLPPKLSAKKLHNRLGDLKQYLFERALRDEEEGTQKQRRRRRKLGRTQNEGM